MASLFRPDKYYKNIYEINYQLLVNDGIKLIAFDLDNTLVPHDVLVMSEEVKNMIEKIKKLGFEVIILSNNNQKRVTRFCEKTNIAYYYSCKKPLRRMFKKVLLDFNLEPSQVCLIGDQVMTDVYGANRMDIMSILVEPIATRDIIYTKVNRQLERFVLRKLEKKSLFKIGEYYE